jgi:hypothetical protein
MNHSNRADLPAGGEQTIGSSYSLAYCFVRGAAHKTGCRGQGFSGGH